jgi:hypothetical protein
MFYLHYRAAAWGGTQSRIRYEFDSGQQAGIWAELKRAARNGVVPSDISPKILNQRDSTSFFSLCKFIIVIPKICRFTILSGEITLAVTQQLKHYLFIFNCIA